MDKRIGAQLMKAVMLLALGLLVAQAAEPTGTLTLACEGNTDMSSDKINMGIIVDFQKKVILGLSGDSEVVPITNITETVISFAANQKEIHWVMTGTLDRVTGALVASSIPVRPKRKNNTVGFVEPAMQANATDVGLMISVIMIVMIPTTDTNHVGFPLVTSI